MEADARQKQQFSEIKRPHQPARPILANLFWAFAVGGAICAVGQGVLQFFLARQTSLEVASGPTAAVMIFLGALFTGLGLYDRLARFAGMGASLPITGFANAIVSPAMEFKREGWVLGVGARMFQIAGPVLVYGIVTSVAIGLVWYLLFGPKV